MLIFMNFSALENKKIHASYYDPYSRIPTKKKTNENPWISRKTSLPYNSNIWFVEGLSGTGFRAEISKLEILL